MNEFEREAKRNMGSDRMYLRKPEPTKPLKERVNEAIAYYENLAKTQAENKLRRQSTQNNKNITNTI